MTTLAARKKSAATRMSTMKGTPASLHSSTPYIDPRRVHRDMLRPTNPDKWVSSEGMRPYKKGEGL